MTKTEKPMSVADYQARILEMQSWTPQERKEELSKRHAEIVESFVEQALLYVACEQAGDDVSFVPSGIAAIYKKIVAGHLLPAVLNLDGNLRQRVCGLPVQDQELVLKGKRFPLVVIDNGATTIRKVDPRMIMPEQVRQLFGVGFIRSEEEQRSWLETQSKKEPAKIEQLVEVRKNCIIVNGVKLSKRQLEGYVKQLKGKE